MPVPPVPMNTAKSATLDVSPSNSPRQNGGGGAAVMNQPKTTTFGSPSVPRIPLPSTSSGASPVPSVPHGRVADLEAKLQQSLERIKSLEVELEDERRNAEAIEAAIDAAADEDVREKEAEVERLRAALRAAEEGLNVAKVRAATPRRSATPRTASTAMGSHPSAMPPAAAAKPQSATQQHADPNKRHGEVIRSTRVPLDTKQQEKKQPAVAKVRDEASFPLDSILSMITRYDDGFGGQDELDVYDVNSTDYKYPAIPSDRRFGFSSDLTTYYVFQDELANQQELEQRQQWDIPQAVVKQQQKKNPSPALKNNNRGSAASNGATTGGGIYRPGQQLANPFQQQPSMGPPPPPHRDFKGPGPAAEGQLKAMFEGGLLYRIIDGDTWYFYNDTQKYEMHVTYKFGPNSELLQRDKTTMRRDGQRWIVCELTILPGETREFVHGKVNGFKSSINAEPLSVEARNKARRKAASVVVQEMMAFQQASATVRNKKDDEALLAACVRAGVKFVDTNFVPDETSLSRPGQDRRDIEPTAWKRPTQYLPADLHPYLAVHRRIEPNDIDQGMLGDCWFLCSVASLAEFPSKVRDIFEHPSSRETARREQALGAYRVTLNKHGWWYVVIVDDYLPVLGDKPCFAKNVEDQTELWVSLLEKAYAKLHGSYAAIAGGDALHALQDLSGYPVSRFDDEEWKEAQESRAKGQELFEMLVRYDESRYLINLNTPGTDDSAYMGGAGAGNSEDFQARYKRAGLGMGHAYSVLQVKNFAQYGLRLVQIRNPWGNGTEWTGAWSDEDPKWNQYPDVASACGFEPGEDGTFWMAWEDVLRYFDGGGACLTKFNWFDYRVRGQFANGVPDMCFEVTVTEPVEAFLVFSQKDKRAAAGYKYEALLLSVCKSVEDGYMEVDLSSTSDADRPSSDATYCYGRDRAMKYTFVPENGPYLVVPRVYDPSNIEYVLGIISSKRAGRGIEVQFKSMSEDCRLLKNYVGFEYDSRTVQAKSAAYQFNPEVGCPMDCRGPCLSNV